MDLTANVIKFILFISNFIFLVIGLLLVILGCINEYSDDIAYKIFDHFDFVLIGGFLIFIGACICVVSFFGCWGAYYEKYSMLYMYGILLSVLLLLQLIFYGVALYLYKKDSSELIVKNAIEKFFEKYYNYSDVRLVIDETQSHYECCGIDGPDYWTNNNKKIPPSCYPNNESENENNYKQGCIGYIEDFITSKFRLSFIVWSVIIQIFVVGSTFFLAKEVRKNRDEYDVI